jgi:hypothetical protein
VLPPRSIAAHAPALDRDVLRAMVAPNGPWARDPSSLARQVAVLLGRESARWVAEPEDALLAALAARAGSLHLAMPAFGHPGFEATRLRADTRVHWMNPAQDRLDPGPSQVAEALDAGANAVLLTPLAGDCSALPDVARLCEARGAVLAVDARASMAARVLDGGPAAWGDLCLVPVDAEGGPSPCPGAILLGEHDDRPTATGGPQPTLLLRTLKAAVRDEPHVRRFLRPLSPPPGPPRLRAPSAWAVAAASARALQSAHRNTQRARHGRSLQIHCSHLPAVRVPPAAPGHQAAGIAVPMLARGRDGVIEVLKGLGLEPVEGLGAWLAPPEARDDRAQDVADGLLAVPLHPFYRPRDIDWLAECLRKATLRINGDGSADPTEAVDYAAKAAGEL